MSMEIASICVNLTRIATKAEKANTPLIAELAREVASLCHVVQQLQQANKAKQEEPRTRQADAG
jgi:hypothetical protein